MDIVCPTSLTGQPRSRPLLCFGNRVGNKCGVRTPSRRSPPAALGVAGAKILNGRVQLRRREREHTLLDPRIEVKPVGAEEARRGVVECERPAGRHDPEVVRPSDERAFSVGGRVEGAEAHLYNKRVFGGGERGMRVKQHE
eukprot:scaffold209828_cov23-Tisochrysis_lutea.AAC.4